MSKSYALILILSFTLTVYSAYPDCTDGEWKDDTNEKCVFCNATLSNCNMCTAADTCTGCNDKFILDGKVCAACI